MTDVNYQVAVDLLQGQYGSDEQRVQELTLKLGSLKPSSKFIDDVQLQLQFESILMQLRNLGQNINSDNIWIGLQRKLTQPTLREVLNIKEARAPGAVWDTDAFRAAVRTVISKEKSVRSVFEQERLDQSQPEGSKSLKVKKEERSPKQKESSSTLCSAVEETKSSRASKSKPKEEKRKQDARRVVKCSLCEANHWASDCAKYKNYASRVERIKNLKLCFKCLKTGHRSSECEVKLRPCFYCKDAKHNRAICRKEFDKKVLGVAHEAEETEDYDEAEPKITGMAKTNQLGNCTLFLCATVEVYNPKKPARRRQAMVFFDCGSEKSYVSKSLMSKLELKPHSLQSFKLCGIEGRDLGDYKGALTQIGLSSENFDLVFDVNETKKIVRPLYKVTITEKLRSKLKQRNFTIPVEIAEPDLLVGMDQFSKFDIQPIEQLVSGFWMSTSKVGLMLSGKGHMRSLPAIEATTIQMTQMTRVNAKNDSELTDLVRQNFDAEKVGFADTKDLDEEQFWLEQFQKDISFNGTRYEVGLPWNELKFELPSNYALALGRLRSTVNRLRKTPELIKTYHDTIMDQLNRQMIEPAPDEVGETVHYLPHQAVIRQDKATTKLRVVIQGNARAGRKALCLNDCLHKGPNLLNDLAGILLRSRLYKTILVADIEKAFLQIAIRPADRDAVRFLWLKDPYKEDSAIITYRFTRVAFGLISSPSQLATTLKYHLDKSELPIANLVSRDLYVDNILVGLNSPGQIAEAYKTLKKIFKEAGMNIREFASNVMTQIQQLPPEDQVKGDKMKILGIEWDLEEDELIIKLPPFESDKKVTRREVLSQLAKPFDPLGIISPALLKIKLFLQKLIKEKKIEWDEEIPTALKPEWEQTIGAWKDITFRVPRICLGKKANSRTQYELHVFSDASGYGLGIAVYLRAIGEKIETSLIFAKSLVKPANTPKKHDTIPKLELQALVLASKIAAYTQKELDKAIKIAKVQFWVDSMDVIDWLRSKSRLETVVENRIRKLRHCPTRHVSGTENPADYAS